MCCPSLGATVSVALDQREKMDLNFRKAGNRLLKASKEASESLKAGSDAAMAGLKAGSDAAIESYNRAKNKNSSFSTTGVVNSRIIEESESEVHHGKSKSVDSAVGKRQEPLRLQQEKAPAPGGRSREAGIRRQTSRRCASAPCQGLTESIEYSLKYLLHQNLVTEMKLVQYML